MMKPTVHIFLFLVLAASAPADAALLGDLFEKNPFRISLPGNKTLAEQFEKQLAEQRDTSAEYKVVESRQRIIQFDRRTLKKLLEAEGFYDARIDTSFENDKLRYAIDAGRPFTIQSVKVKFPEGIALPEKTVLPVVTGKRLRAQDVLDSVKLLENHVLENHCLYKVNVTYSARVDHNSAKAWLTFALTDSPAVTFAEPELTGLERIETDYMARYLTFSEGDCFKRDVIEEARLALLQSNLIASSDITITEPQNGQVKTRFNLTERQHRTVRAGIGYESITGVGVTLGWQHRNLFHRGRRLDIETRLSEQETGIRTELLAPHFGRKGQTLTLHADVTREVPDAYEVVAGEIGATLNRSLRRYWAGDIGTVLEFSRVEDDGDQTDFALLSFPVGLQYNRTGSLLDPRSGWSVNLKTQPFVDLYATGRRFVKTSLVGAVYFTEEDWPLRPTLAVRASTGTISGTSLEAVPEHHRYYVGGGGSVRGYAYQSLGTLDEEGKPVGGLSYGETSVEVRLRIAESWGAVIFTDGGYAYTDELPEFGRDFLWGAGIGVRYYTSFAPFRLDIATPMTRRRDAAGARIDNDIELYISIGQAF